MKKILIVLLSIFILTALALSLVGCVEPRIVSITATYEQNDQKIYPSNSLSDLMKDLTVVAHYSNGKTNYDYTDYTLSGNLEAGISTITVTANNTNAITTFDVEVSAVMVVEINATFDTNGTTIYTSTDLETLKQYLTVKATYNDESVEENFTDYTLSGNLEAGISTITVTVNNTNLSTTFDVEVSAVVATSIQVFEEQCKTHFIETDILNNEDFYVQTNYNDGSFKRITDFEMDKTQIAIDDTQIVFTYQGRQAILSITVEKKVVALEFEGYQQNYVDGEMFSCQNLKVYAVYLDNTKALVDDYQIDTADGCELALDSVVNVTVQNCTQELPIKVEYKSHEDYSLSYINQEKEYKISKYTGLDKEILLPEKIDNISVTTIGNEAFEDAPNLKVVKIQNNITSIENGAFDNCNQLFICVEADFAPDSWGDWNKNNFPVVWAFKTIVVDDYFDYAIFQEEVYITAYKGLAETVIVPDFIENYPVVSLTSAFADKTFLKNILLPEEIKEISSSMFSGCTSLQMVEIPSHITIIGDYAFKDCSSIESITIPSSVTSIGSYAFSGCRSLTTVTFGENSQLESIGSYAFSGCSSLTSITIPSSVTSIGSYAFSGCRSLTTVTFGENSQLESIGSYAFSGCSSLTSITIPSSVTSIGSYAFYDCSSLTSITIPSSVTSIGSYAFYGCSSLTSITIPSSVTSIGSRAFYGCSRLQNVYYNGTMEDWCKIEFGSSSSNPMYCAENFYMWNGSEYDLITEIEIPETVTSISDCQFSGFKNLTSITIPSSVTSIGSYAFYGCSSLTNITIPSSVISIEPSAFESCEKLYIFFTGIKTDTQLGDNWNPGNSPAFWSTTITKSNAEFYFDIKEGKAIISRYLGDAESVVIPDIVTIDGINYPIVGLASGTFATNKISHLVIGCNIVQIDFDIFDQLKYLQTLVIADNNENFKVVNDAIYDITGKTLYKVLSYASCEYVVTDGTELINSYAFANNSNIVSVTIPRSVNFIGSLAFLNMTSNQEFTVHSQNEKYTSVDGILMSKDQTELICYPSGKKMQSLDISTNVNYIHNLAFEGCRLAVLTLSLDNLGEIEFKDYLGNNGLIQNLILTSTTNISSGTFEDCMIVNVTIPSSVTSIGSYAFYNCSSLTSITIPSSVTSIGSSAFISCSSLQDVYYNGTMEDWCNIEFGGWGANPMYYYAQNFYMWNGSEYDLITEIEIPETVTSIGAYQFSGFENLTSITIPSSVTSIGSRAFEDCSRLTTVTFGENSQLESIGSYAFYNCSSLASITIPSSVTSIGWSAFYGCSSLSEVYYGGTSEQWEEMSIGSNNGNLTGATIYYYSAVQPTITGNYWHYVDGVPTKWN